MSMNVIIVAVIAILILVIMVFLIGSRTDMFIKGTKCVEAGGRCRDTCDTDHPAVTGLDAQDSCGSSARCCAIVPKKL